MRRPMSPEKLAALAPPKGGGMSAAEFAMRAPGQGARHLRSVGPKERARYLEEARSMLARRNFGCLTTNHLVALYRLCHLEVYGVDASELEDGRAWALAAIEAARLCGREFGGKPEAAVTFVRWVWRREAEREAWRRENGKSGGRIGWKFQFGPVLITDWKIDVARLEKGKQA